MPEKRGIQSGSIIPRVFPHTLAVSRGTELLMWSELTGKPGCAGYLEQKYPLLHVQQSSSKGLGITTYCAFGQQIHQARQNFFSKSICLPLSCRSRILLCIHFTQFPHFHSHSFDFFNFVHTVKPHSHRHRGACAQWVWLGPMPACNLREDGHQLSHPYGISWVILHWQWQSALDGLSGPWAGQTREWC